MQVIQVDGNARVEVVEAAAPSPRPGEVVVGPAACGICGTDLHILHGDFPGTKYPVTPGHEFAGYVAATGRDAGSLREGDFVAVNPNVTCGQCRWCKCDRPNLCESLSPVGVARPGACAERVLVPSANAYRVSSELGAGVAAMVEPLACAANAVHAAGTLRDRDVLVVGGGTMGLLIASLAKHYGAARNDVCEPHEGKHAVARRAGASFAGTPDAFSDERYDVVFEAAGTPPALEAALEWLAPRGVLVQVGVHRSETRVAIKPFRIYERELTIVGSNSLADKFSLATDLMPELRHSVESLITTRRSVWEFSEAVKAMSESGNVKTLLEVN